MQGALGLHEEGGVAGPAFSCPAYDYTVRPFSQKAGTRQQSIGVVLV